jgi:imidazolonepropionase-like amidohydrolase
MEVIIRRGVKFAAGTEGMHGELAQELEYLVQFGASESQALEAVTRNAAAVLGLEGSVETLEPGKFADIVGVERSPLEDIPAVKKVKTVISRGKLGPAS